MQPTLFIGLGGTGIHVANNLYKNLLHNNNSKNATKNLSVNMR